MSALATDRAPVHVTAEVLANRQLGAFRMLTLRAPGLGARARPGTFLLASVPSPQLARRALWVHRVRPSAGEPAAVDVIIAPQGPGSRWLAAQPAGATFEVTGPLGRPYALPREAVPCVLVGQSWHAAPLFGLAERLAEGNCAVTLLLSGSSETDVLPSGDLRRAVRQVLVVTADGTLGQRGTVADVMADVIRRGEAAVVYGSGPREVMAQVSQAAEQADAWAQVSVGESFPCGTGLCFACTVPVLTEGGTTRQVRGCTEGPVFRGDRVHWQGVLG